MYLRICSGWFSFFVQNPKSTGGWGKGGFHAFKINKRKEDESKRGTPNMILPHDSEANGSFLSLKYHVRNEKT